MGGTGPTLVGNLRRLKDLSRDGAEHRSPDSPIDIGFGGWDTVSHLASGGGGQLYAILGGDLKWYKEVDGNWAPGTNSIIGHGGWDTVSHLTACGDGVLYAVVGGDLKWFKDLGQNGAESWAPRTGSVIDRGGWDTVRHLTADGTGVIYAVD